MHTHTHTHLRRRQHNGSAMLVKIAHKNQPLCCDRVRAERSVEHISTFTVCLPLCLCVCVVRACGRCVFLSRALAQFRPWSHTFQALPTTKLPTSQQHQRLHVRREHALSGSCLLPAVRLCPVPSPSPPLTSTSLFTQPSHIRTRTSRHTTTTA